MYSGIRRCSGFDPSIPNSDQHQSSFSAERIGLSIAQTDVSWGCFCKSDGGVCSECVLLLRQNVPDSHLLPTSMLSVLETDGPHVIQPADGEQTKRSPHQRLLHSCGMWQTIDFVLPGVPIIASEYPEFITVDCSPVG